MRRNSSVEEEDSNPHERISVGWILHMKAPIMKIPFERRFALGCNDRCFLLRFA